eukprot:CAMPEP_0175958786 /NCGR_PEP_ID=MMETSP0108-20121206/34435_1 /TAXON_ID=195067 ORGANISM="Goniomonas pacifica, Strain CCMP1869" /NCGR_SAMPLE_ID=MMETSP0108 /ASSEMBLY_ACC=CAM_ASM_000204 /LENGTH=211 /DNA_ID=CAMNT_0017286167 /DNA_START=6 /DNA_END=641 /DNA_ORIENTATION=-
MEKPLFPPALPADEPALPADDFSDEEEIPNSGPYGRKMLFANASRARAAPKIDGLVFNSSGCTGGLAVGDPFEDCVSATFRMRFSRSARGGYFGIFRPESPDVHSERPCFALSRADWMAFGVYGSTNQLQDAAPYRPGDEVELIVTPNGQAEAGSSDRFSLTMTLVTGGQHVDRQVEIGPPPWQFYVACNGQTTFEFVNFSGVGGLTKGAR